MTPRMRPWGSDGGSPQRVFGARTPGEQIPEPLADVVGNPRDEDAVAALRLAVRKALRG